MREFLDEYHGAVGCRFSHQRSGARRQRIDRIAAIMHQRLEKASQLARDIEQAAEMGAIKQKATFDHLLREVERREAKLQRQISAVEMRDRENCRILRDAEQQLTGWSLRNAELEKHLASSRADTNVRERVLQQASSALWRRQEMTFPSVDQKISWLEEQLRVAKLQNDLVPTVKLRA